MIEDLNDVVNTKRLLLKEMDAMLVKAIKKRCNELSAISNFGLLVQSHLGNCESLKGNFENCYSMTLSGNVRLIIKPNSKDLSMECLKACEEYYFIGVVDYHDKRNKPSWIIP